jgi:hypothetical protein
LENILCLFDFPIGVNVDFVFSNKSKEEEEGDEVEGIFN